MRTYTVYFSEDTPALQALKQAYNQLVQDWEERSEYMQDHVYIAGERRLEILGNTIDLLKEQVPE